MSPRRLLVAVSAGQLAAGLTGQVVALRRRRPFDIAFMTGSPAHVGRDSWWFGTAYSAPSYMLGSQAYAVAKLAAGPDDRARGMLRLLGTSMIAGYLCERFNRQVLTGRVVDRIGPGAAELQQLATVVLGRHGAASLLDSHGPSPFLRARRPRAISVSRASSRCAHRSR